MKINRQEVFDKCNGKCGYCGDDISINKFQVDHIVSRFHYENNLNKKYGSNTDINHIDNLMPSCSVCNKWKSAHSLEQFRKEISLQLERLNKYNSNYRFAKKYNLINETPHEILFHFEKINYIMKPQKFNTKTLFDNRGSFSPLSLKLFDVDWLQSNISINDKKGTLRGLHFQNDIHAQSKLINVVRGEIIDFIVDIRPNSDTYMETFVYELLTGEGLLVPKGFAHGFITKSDNTIVQYLVDNDYNPESEGVICWEEITPVKDLVLSLFNKEDMIISEKDLITKNFVN